MRKATKSIIIILFLSSAQWSNAQDSATTSTSEFSGLFKSKEKSFKTRWALNEPNNEFQLSTYALFFFYKEFVSSQDNSVCNFYPSCSVYAVHTIQKKGALIGIMAAFDRLMRCNGLNPEDYPIHPSTRLLYDPVE